MNRIIASALLLSAVTANAQVKNGMVGINTDEPRATMHIEPGVSESKGLIIPRITAAQMKTMTNLAHFGADHHAIITYLKEPLPATDRTGKLADVADPGYYYYDNTTGVQKWKTFGGDGEQDFRKVGVDNYLTKDAGIDGNGTSLGTGDGSIGIGKFTFGGFASSNDLTGRMNIALGRQTYNFQNGAATMSGNNNIGIGEVLYDFQNGGSMQGGNNIAMGRDMYNFAKSNALFSGNWNIGIGYDSYQLLYGDLLGTSNISLGNDNYRIYSGDMIGVQNIAIGHNSYGMNYVDITTNAQNNISIGSNNYSVRNPSIPKRRFSGDHNIGLGSDIFRVDSGDFNGFGNIGIGSDSYLVYGGDLRGVNNIVLGRSTMKAYGGIKGSYNISLGYGSMDTVGKIDGDKNIALGYHVLYPGDNTDIGSYNIGIGDQALNAGMAKGNANIQLGNNQIGTPVAGQLNNVVAIGNEMNGLSLSNTHSNVILLGNDGSGGRTPSKVGVGTYQPKAKMHVTGEVIVGYEGGNCTSDNVGAIRFDGTHFYGCNGSTWKQLDN